MFVSLKNLDVEEENILKKFDVLNNAFNLYNELIKEYNKNYRRVPKDDKSDSWKQNYDPKKFRDYQPVKLETKSMVDENESSIKQPTQLKQLDLNEMSKPLCIDLFGKDFDWLIKDVNDNLDNKKYKTKVGNIDYNLKNAKNSFVKNRWYRKN